MTDERPLVALVVNDEPDIRELLTVWLSRAGYDVVEAADGEEALQLARRHRADVAVIDLQLPKLDGYDTTRALRANPATAATKIVILTSSVRDSDRDRALAAGADIYLRKPFGGRDLGRRVCEVIRSIT